MTEIVKEQIRSNVICVKLNDAEAELLEQLAMTFNLNRSDFLRFMIAKEASELGFGLPERLRDETT